MAATINHGRDTFPTDVLPVGSSLLTVKQLAESLAISEKTVYAYVAKGIIPFIKIESNVRFRPQAIREWLRQKEYSPCQVVNGYSNRRSA